ncbi:MAG: nuclear transport factor 2 family protein [Bacteroidota bacterium]
MKSLSFILVLASALLLSYCNTSNTTADETESATSDETTDTMELTNREKVVALLNSFNTGDTEPISYINPEKYIQHNLGVADGLAGFGAVMQAAPPQGFSANVIRSFEDGDYVITHTEYDFFGPKVGFDVFRFEDGLIVEHWDNLAEITPPNPSGRTQLDGNTEVVDLDKTAVNKAIVQGFVDNILLNGLFDQVATYINPEKYIQHNSQVADGLDGFGAAMQEMAANGLVMEYKTVHKVLGAGNFVLTMSEGVFGQGEEVAFYDLFRLENGLIVEHWDVIQSIPPREEWKNDNGKF